MIPAGDVVVETNQPHLGGFIHGGDGNTWCPEVWERLIADLEIKSVLDVGCGEGQSLEWFRERGLHAVGVDGSEAACVWSRHEIVQHDFTTGTYDAGEFDLCWCAEFVEHVDEIFTDNFLRTFRSCRFVAMTHAEPGQDGWHHVNCRTTKYWVELMERNGFRYCEAYSERLRGLTAAMHVRRSLLIFERVG